ncbi:MAG: ankyrin repeat domain-containing protein [Treponema sp.]|nr:ankyrin repeat domain-containing protein [Treponema sp.]
MKILLIYLEGEKAKANSVKALFDKKDFTFNPLVLAKPEDEGESFNIKMASFSAPIVSKVGELKQEYAPSHMLILSRLPKRCFDFLAGISCALNTHFPVFGKEAAAGIPKPYSSCFLPIKTDAELTSFLKKEKIAHSKNEAERSSQRARNTLLQMGISVNVDSLVRCVGEGLIHEISLFLAAGFSPDTLSNAGIPLLNIAARKGSRETIRLLVHAGAQLNLLSHDRGSSALIDSVMGKSKSISKDLIKAGADVNIRSKDGQSALIIAVGAGDSTTVQALLEAGADPDVTDNLGVSARKYATLFHNKALDHIFEEYPHLKEH